MYWKQTPEGKLDEDWIFHKLWAKVHEVEWIDYKEGEIRDPNRKRGNDKGYFIDKYAGTPSFIRFEKNKKENSNQFGHIYPKQRVAMNVIDRMDEWCLNNKHSKLLSSSHNPFEIVDDKGGKKTIWFTEKGFPNELYKLFWSQVLEFRGHWDLDMIVHKEEKKYVLRDGMEDKIKESVKRFVNINPLSDEEKQYGLYDVESMFQPIGYYKIYNSFEKLFKQADLDFGSKFHPELVELYEVEKIQREKEKKEKDPKGEAQSTTGGYEPETKQEESVPHRRRAESVEESVESKLSKFPNWDKLDQKDKASFVANTLSVEGETFSYKENTSLIPCDCEKALLFPDDVLHCISCGKKFN